jgi:hypothetical protein
MLANEPLLLTSASLPAVARSAAGERSQLPSAPIREAMAFWVEARPLSDSRARLWRTGCLTLGSSRLRARIRSPRGTTGGVVRSYGWAGR